MCELGEYYNSLERPEFGELQIRTPLDRAAHLARSTGTGNYVLLAWNAEDPTNITLATSEAVDEISEILGMVGLTLIKYPLEDSK